MARMGGVSMDLMSVLFAIGWMQKQPGNAAASAAAAAASAEEAAEAAAAVTPSNSDDVNYILGV